VNKLSWQTYAIPAELFRRLYLLKVQPTSHRELFPTRGRTKEAVMTHYRFREISNSAAQLIGVMLACWSSSSMAQPLARPQSLAGAGTELQMVQHRSVYDGHWIANVPPQGTCPASRLTLNVRGSSIRGTAVNPFGVFPIVGSLGGEGSGTIKIMEMGGTIRFTGNRFVARYLNVCGPRYAVGARIAVHRSSTERI
jgi:hypothetical protein